MIAKLIIGLFFVSIKQFIYSQNRDSIFKEQKIDTLSYRILIDGVRMSNTHLKSVRPVFVDTFMNWELGYSFFKSCLGAEYYGLTRSKLNDSIYIFIVSEIYKKDTSFVISFNDIKNNKRISSIEIAKYNKEKPQVQIRILRDSINPKDIIVEYRFVKNIQNRAFYIPAEVKNKYKNISQTIVDIDMNYCEYKIRNARIIDVKQYTRPGWGYYKSADDGFVGIFVDLSDESLGEFMDILNGK